MSKKPKIPLVEALQCVIDLASENVLTDNVCFDAEQKREQKRQHEALARVEALLAAIIDY